MLIIAVFHPNEVVAGARRQTPATGNDHRSPAVGQRRKSATPIEPSVAGKDQLSRFGQKRLSAIHRSSATDARRRKNDMSQAVVIAKRLGAEARHFSFWTRPTCA
jgi:hypothetical protein